MQQLGWLLQPLTTSIGCKKRLLSHMKEGSAEETMGRKALARLKSANTWEAEIQKICSHCWLRSSDCPSYTRRHWSGLMAMPHYASGPHLQSASRRPTLVLFSWIVLLIKADTRRNTREEVSSALHDGCTIRRS
jgi:hypothetical protein